MIEFKFDTSSSAGNKPFYFVNTETDTFSSFMTFVQSELVKSTMREMGIVFIDRTV